MRTYSTGNGPERGHSLDVVGIATPEGVALGVLASLQHKLLALVGGMLIANPARKKNSHTHLFCYTYKEYVLSQCIHV